MGADGAQAVVVEELADLLGRDGSDVALGVPGELDLGVPDVGELLEHRAEAEARDLVADRVELDADVVRRDQSAVAGCADTRGGGGGGRCRRRLGGGGSEADRDGRGRERLDQAATRHLGRAHRLSFEG
ncbi:hypothetical protein [Cellulosimicrobium marinum]|uniref:hypothetical protein n=1 Tax=Cellulosimicrobium marinum TaxID=1638992 RepID=UPI001E5EFF38|nr:hypothetical protein [Cellulosimicrobium marinum]MCB7135860.1 hypothetical protein [Cellulosimicrobium marinum]